MEKYIYNNNGLWHELQGDYYIPCLALGEEETQPIGMWGRKYLRHIKEHRPVLHTTLLFSLPGPTTGQQEYLICW